MARAAVAESEGAVHFMLPTEGSTHVEVEVLGQNICRWDEGNLPELCMLALKGCVIVKRPEVEPSVAFQLVLRRLCESLLNDSAAHLAALAHRPCKFTLAKHALRASDRGLGWLCSHAQARPLGARQGGRAVCERAVMVEGSHVPAPEIVSPTRKRPSRMYTSVAPRDRYRDRYTVTCAISRYLPV